MIVLLLYSEWRILLVVLVVDCVQYSGHEELVVLLSV